MDAATSAAHARSAFTFCCTSDTWCASVIALSFGTDELAPTEPEAAAATTKWTSRRLN